MKVYETIKRVSFVLHNDMNLHCVERKVPTAGANFGSILNEKMLGMSQHSCAFLVQAETKLDTLATEPGE